MNSPNTQAAGAGGEEPHSTGADPHSGTDETTIQDVVSRVDALSRQLDAVREELEAEREKRRERDEEIADLKEEVEELDARTNILEIVDDVDEMDARQRAVTLVTHLHRSALARERRGEPAKASVNRDQAEEALHFPDVERTTIYRDMERAARILGNDDLLEYDAGELRLDLEAGDLPAKYAVNGGDNL